MKSIQVAWADKMDFRIPITIFSRETLNDYKLPTRYHTYREIAPPMDWSSFVLSTLNRFPVVAGKLSSRGHQPIIGCKNTS
jgi:hypothetical protein